MKESWMSHWMWSRKESITSKKKEEPCLLRKRQAWIRLIGPLTNKSLTENKIKLYFQLYLKILRLSKWHSVKNLMDHRWKQLRIKTRTIWANNNWSHYRSQKKRWKMFYVIWKVETGKFSFSQPINWEELLNSTLSWLFRRRQQTCMWSF